MNSTFRLVIVEDQQADAEMLVAELNRAGFAPDWARVDTAEQLVEALYPAPALIFCDYRLPGLDAVEVLNILRELKMDIPVIVVTGQLDEETCVKSLRLGAVDYLLKDRLARLGPAVEHALATRQLGIEKREAERKERETAGILRAVVTHSPAAISVKAVDGRYLLSNRQFESINGLAPGASIGQIDADLFPDRAREMIELDARCLHNSIVVEREEEFSDQTGVRHLLSVRYPMINEQQQVFAIGVIYLDITRQKQIESELRAARTDILSRAELLGISNQQLRERDRVKTNLITTVGHELRTPLTSIRGYVEMLQDQELDLAAGVGRQFLSIIDRNSEQLLTLIDDLLILTRNESPVYSDRDVPIAELVAAAVTLLQPIAQRAGLSVSVQVDDDLPPVAGDPDQLERVLANLLSNAVKFSADPGMVSVVVSGHDDGISLVVADQGIGIALSDQPLLFSRFFRTKTVIEQGIPGTGLGLAVVKGIVEEHGGTVEVTSALGQGTAVTVQLPSSR